MSKRIIPTTMMTQHPDSATKYIPIQEEPKEAIDALKYAPEGLGIEEIMIDFEGKLTPYHQTAQVVIELLQNGITPGKDVFVTPRVANARKETAFRQIMAFLSVMETIVTAKEYTDIQTVIEVILPMASSAKELIEVKKRIDSVLQLTHQEFSMTDELDLLQIIPLFEEVPELMNIDSIIYEFVTEQKRNGYSIDYLRFMLGRSDPALSYGNVAAVLANRVALSKAYNIGKKLGIEIYPIFGGGALPFRGHVTLENINNVLKTYPGLRTITIQSGIRYDQSREKVQQLTEILKKKLPESQPYIYSEDGLKQIYNFIGIFTSTYLEIFLKIIPSVVRLSDFMPRQRDRLARKSAVGYARDIAKPDEVARFITDKRIYEELSKHKTNMKVTLPRAITYTASLYSIGLPPSFIGTGTGLKKVKEMWGQKGLDALMNEYPSLKADLEFDCKFVNIKNIKRFFSDEVAKEIEADIQYSCEMFNLSLSTEKELQNELYHVLMDSSLGVLYHIERAADVSRPHEIELLQHWLKEMGSIRGSLG